MFGTLVFVSSFLCLYSASVICLEVELILEYETMEYKNTTMECKYDLEGSTLGEVVWEKDGKTFFEYNRRRVPHYEENLVPGISLDVEKSNMTHVFLTNLKPESSGEYSCTVTTSGGGIQAAIARENMTTAARDPTHLLVTTRKGMFLITTQNYSSATSLDDSDPVDDGTTVRSSVAYHFSDGTIFKSSKTGIIYHVDFHESETDATALPTLGGTLILAEEGQVTSLAVDWLRNTLYFTDDLLDTIGMVNLTSERKDTLLDSSQGVKTPESIVVDPFQGYLFWGDNNERDKKIVASDLDGKTNRQTIVSSDLRRAILALDLDRRRLFFIDNEGLSSCKYDGSARRVDFRYHMLDSQVNSLSYYDEFIFWSRYDSRRSSSGLFFTKINSPEVGVKELPVKSILDMKVFNPQLQRPALQYHCALLKCSDGCTSDSSGSAHCTCPAGHTLTAGATVCIAVNKDKTCEKSQTAVNSVPACKGEIVFEEHFNSSTLDLSKWQHTIRISSKDEMEFVVYDKDRKNIYIKDGNLVIKPTLIDDDIVTSGNISLIGCTTPVAGLCEQRALSFIIIPPVKAALVNTAHTFVFRYGEVTIRAKLPKGDWIYPVLNLHVAKDFYSPDYASGVIRLVDVRGNQQLTCDGKESGVKNLMSGVMHGTLLKIRRHFINKLADNEWTKNFHVFKFTWTPDDLLFSVDDKPAENILPDGQTLRDALGLNKGNSSKRVDPFNQDVYLSVGVGVGGAIEFPDNCISYAQEKPWRNYQVKSMLKFWQKKASWSSSWGEHSALLVDYVTVRAL